MPPQRTFGQIEFAGQMWRWTAVSHSSRPGDPGSDASGTQRVGCFQRLDQRVSCELPRGDGKALTDQRLLRLLEETRFGTCRPEASGPPPASAGR